jgi:hypothetical protein
MIRGWNNCQSEWTNKNLKLLVPDEIDKEHKRLYMMSRRLQTNFEQNKVDKVKKLTEEIKV